MHSFHIFLACALRDAGKTNAELREALRWATDDALILYARANLLADAKMRAGAARANVESVRVPTVLSSASRAAEELRRLGSVVVGASEESLAIDELPASVPNQVISNSIEVTTTAATRIHAVDTQAELPEVDSDLRVFSEISMGLANLAKQAARPIETRNNDDDEEAEDV